MSSLPITAPLAGALGFFAVGVSGGSASLSAVMGASLFGGIIIWPFGLLLHMLFVEPPHGLPHLFGVSVPSFLMDCVTAIPAVMIGAASCCLGGSFLATATVGAALLYLLGQVVYFDLKPQENVHASPVKLHILGSSFPI